MERGSTVCENKSHLFSFTEVTHHGGRVCDVRAKCARKHLQSAFFFGWFLMDGAKIIVCHRIATILYACFLYFTNIKSRECGELESRFNVR